MIKGSCLCGAVHYESADLASPIGLCHCRTCQKAHASGYNPTALAPRDGFRWAKGENTVAAFESTPGKNRWFCPKCGTQLMAEWTDKDQVIIRVGSLDTILDQQPAVHIYMDDATGMLEAHEDMVSFAESFPK